MSNDEGHRRVQVRTAWLRWLALWVPLMATITVASRWLDFKAIIAVLLAILALGILHQRHVRKRSWRSIMWGVHARDE